METYKKVVSAAGRTSYQIIEPVPQALSDSMTEREIITAVANLAVLAINGYQVMLPEKACSANRVKGVRESVLKMFKDTGCEIDHATVQHVCNVWDGTMKTLSGREL